MSSVINENPTNLFNGLSGFKSLSFKFVNPLLCLVATNMLDSSTKAKRLIVNSGQKSCVQCEYLVTFQKHWQHIIRLVGLVMNDLYFDLTYPVYLS